MKTYTVFGKAIVEVSMGIEAENMENALRKANESEKILRILRFLVNNLLMSP